MLDRMTRTALMGIAAAGLIVGLAGCGQPAQATAATPTPRTVHISMQIKSGTLKGQENPYFTNAAWKTAGGSQLQKGDTVDLTIVSYDDGPAPAPPGFGKVTGTVGGKETVDGKTVTSVPIASISHTFTISSMGVNIPIPVAPTGGSITVSAQIHLTKSGTFSWQCFAPCGTGSSGWDGAMSTDNWMKGYIRVQS